MKCRHCATPLADVFVDLGTAPPSNAFLTREQLDRPEVHFPLKVWTCAECKLVQVDEVQSHEALFDADYVYHSSYSRSWLAHARRYVELACDRLALDRDSLVMEVASNDGYLLQYVKERGVPCVGVEPTASTARVARDKGIETIESFFGRGFAERFVDGRERHADLVIGNNVLAHVPDIDDFVAGLAAVLAPAGTVTLEFPHLLRLVQHSQFDTIYHEHFSYLSLLAVERILRAHGLAVWDVDTLTTHGGSLRVWAQHAAHGRAPTPRVDALRLEEASAGMREPGFYRGLQREAERIKNDFIAFLIEQKRAGRRVAAYGAAAKGNTLLNFAGVRPDLLPYVVDASPHKQGRFLPGSRIPVVDEDHLRRHRPDFIVVLPWNLRAEIGAQLAYARAWGARLVTAVPRLQID
jgi:SAM-dependent methyltransferase